MFVNRIKICPDLHKLQLRFSRLRQCLFLKLPRLRLEFVGYIRYRSAAHVLSSTYKTRCFYIYTVKPAKKGFIWIKPVLFNHQFNSIQF
jgi:hypothetical protein